jgi:hypothetical protein
VPKVSLGSTTIKDPGTLERFSAASAEYDRPVSGARKAASGTFDPLDALTIAYLAKVLSDSSTTALSNPCGTASPKRR